jgi:hypothetical protein
MRHTEYDIPDPKDAVLKEDLTHIFEDPLLPPFLETMGNILTERNRTYRDNRRERNLAHLANIGDEAAIVLGLDERKKEDLLEKYNRIILLSAEKFKRKTHNFRHNTTGEDEDGLAHMFLQISQATVRFDWQEFVDNRDIGLKHYLRFVQASLYDSAAQTAEASYHSVPTSALLNPDTELLPEHLFSVPDKTDEIDFSNLGELLSSLQIPETSKNAFLLQFVSKKKIREIADILGGTNDEIKRSIRTVKNALKNVLRPQSDTHLEQRNVHVVNPIWLDIIEKTTYYQNLLQQKRLELPPFVEKVFAVSLEAIDKGASTREQVIEFVGLHPEFTKIKAEGCGRGVFVGKIFMI